MRKKEIKREAPTRNLFRLLKEDGQKEHASRTIERAMQAVMAAVYFDGGLQGLRRVMAKLGLTIKVRTEQDQGGMIDVGFSRAMAAYRDDEGE